MPMTRSPRSRVPAVCARLARAAGIRIAVSVYGKGQVWMLSVSGRGEFGSYIPQTGWLRAENRWKKFRRHSEAIRFAVEVLRRERRLVA
jgi:hypothetical protein